MTYRPPTRRQPLPPARPALSGRVSFGPPQRNPRMAMSQRELRKPLVDYKHWKESWFREVVQNSLDAAATRVDFTSTKQRNGNVVIQATDNGYGMDGGTLLNKFLVLGATSKGAGDFGGFGEAKKLLLWPWKFWALSTCSGGTQTFSAAGIGDNFDLFYGSEDAPRKMTEEESYGEVTYTLGAQTRKTVKWPGGVEPSDVRLPPRVTGTKLTIICDASEVPDTASMIAWLSKSTIARNIEAGDGGVKITLNGREVRDNMPTAGFVLAKQHSDSYMDLYYRASAGGSDLDATGDLIVQAGRTESRRLAMWSSPLSGISGTILCVCKYDTKEMLTSNRDSFRYSQFDSQIERFKNKLTQDPLTAMDEPANFDKEFMGDGVPVDVIPKVMASAKRRGTATVAVVEALRDHFIHDANAAHSEIGRAHV